MPAFLSNLLGGPYAVLIKYGAVVLAVISLCSGSYLYGLHHEKVVIETKTVEKIVTQIKAGPKEDAQIIVQLKGVKVLHDVTETKIPYIIQADPHCDVGLDTVILLNTNRNLSAIPPNDGYGAAAASNQ